MIAFLGFSYAGNDNSKDKNSNTTPATTISVSGQVIDFTTGEALTGVEISLEGTDQKVYSDFDGNFKFENLNKGEYNVVASFISYENSLIENFEADKNQQINIKMKAD